MFDTLMCLHRNIILCFSALRSFLYRFFAGLFKYNRVCVVGTPYALLLYLLYSSYNEILHTRFFVSNAISYEIYSKLPSCVYIESWKWKSKNRNLLYAKFKYGLRCLFSSVYAQDHFPHSSSFIGFSRYTLIEDGAGWYTYYVNNKCFNVNKKKSLKDILIEFFLYGPAYGKTIGRNFLCKDRLVTDCNDLNSIVLIGKRSTLIDINKLWDASSLEKRKFICDVFCMDDFINAKNPFFKKVVFLTQPFVFLGDLSELEQVELIRGSLSCYEMKDVCIKPHPDDEIDYSIYFPNATILSCHTPMQLLVLCGFKVEIAITFFSTAVSLMPKGTKIIWLGGKCHPKLSKYGMNECPYYI